MDNNIIMKYLEPLIDERTSQNTRNTAIKMLKDSFDLITPLIIETDCCLLLMDNHKNIIGVYSHNPFPELENLLWTSLSLPFINTIELGQLAKKIDEANKKYETKLEQLPKKKYKSSNKNIIRLGQLPQKKTDKENEENEVKLYLYQYFSGIKCIENYYLCMITPNQNDTLNNILLKRISEDINKSVKLAKKYYNHNRFLMKCLDAVEDGISVCDKDGYVMYVNNACCRLLGMKRDEFLFKPAQNVTNNKPTLIRIIEDKKKLVDFEYFLNLKANNKTIHLINSGYPVFDDNGEILGAINIFRGIKRSRKLANTIAGYKGTYEFKDIIGESCVIKDKVNLAKLYSRNTANILIQGESGTGKELFAQSIHNYSIRKSEPFIPINCANFPNELIDSELFGYEEGAFTGAQKGGRPGKFELANGGTLFFDEIGEMPLYLQAKLLRVVETKTITRIGGDRLFKVDVRIIAATNRELEKSVGEGKFRKDLYYRLKVLFLDIPPLRERKEDILILTEYFINKLMKKVQKKVKGIDRDGEKVMMSYNWPGNVRQLENIISRALYICEGDYLTKEHLLSAGLKEIKRETNRGSAEKKLVDINKEIILDTLKLTSGNKKKAAEILGISRPTIYRILKER